MIAKQLISQSIPPLKTSDTGEQAMAMMQLYNVRHMPIVNNEQLLGILSEEDILNNNDTEPIGSYHLALADSFVNEEVHIFEVMSKIAMSKLSVIAVIDYDENYAGMITLEKLLQCYADSFSFKEPGSILILETTKRNYSLHEISRIVEEESAAIISCFLTDHENQANIYVTLKINKHEINHIIASFERYDYGIKASFTKEEYFSTLQDRYDSLMKYLSV